MIYEFTFDVTVEGTSYDYLGRDDDTKEVIRSEGKSHVFEGQITIQVEREAEVFYDFEDDNSYENVSIPFNSLVFTIIRPIQVNLDIAQDVDGH